MVLFCRGIKTQHVFELNYKQMWCLDIKIKKIYIILHHEI